MVNEDTMNFFKMSTLAAFKNELGYDNITLDNLTFTELQNPDGTFDPEWAKYYVVAELPEEIDVPDHIAADMAKRLSMITEDAEH